LKLAAISGKSPAMPNIMQRHCIDCTDESVMIAAVSGNFGRFGGQRRSLAWLLRPQLCHYHCHTTSSEFICEIL
jgi:hypothetical protein